jgi:hypothetical protein
MRADRIAVVGCATLILGFILTTAPTWAQPSTTSSPSTAPTAVSSGPGVGTAIHGGGTVNSGGVSAGLNGPGSAPAPSGDGGGGTVTGSEGGTSPCTWQYVGSQANGHYEDGPNAALADATGIYSGMTADSAGIWIPISATGSWYLMTCPGKPPEAIFVPAGTGGRASTPPPPPGPAEAAAAPCPAETIHFNPCGTGVTGLASWFWATVGPGAGAAVPPVAASAAIRCYTVQVTARPVSYRWDITGVSAPVAGIDVTLWGTTSGTLTRDPAGQLSSMPSVSWMPQTRGMYQVTLTVAWSGQYTFSGYGITQTSALGPVDQAPQVRSMPVEEIRSVLLSPDSTNPPTTLAPPPDPFTC